MNQPLAIPSERCNIPHKPGQLWKTVPMGGAAAERMERRGMTAHLDHAVSIVTGKPLCGKVKVKSLCWDYSLMTNDLPDCPVCRVKIAKMNVSS